MAKITDKNTEQLTLLKVDGLFGRFDHLLEFNPQDDLTIITAPNGYGKTMLIRILDAFFNRRFSLFLKLDFQKITISFASGKRIEIFKKPPTQSNKDIEDSADSENTEDDAESRGGKNTTCIKTTGFGNDEDSCDIKQIVSTKALKYIERHFPVERVGSSRWYDYESGDHLTTNEIANKFGHMTPIPFGLSANVPPWLEEAVGATDTHLIETQRLLSFENDDDAGYRNKGRLSKSTSVVDADAGDLSERIGEVLTDYANEAQKLDESFPRRIIDVFSGNSGTVDVVTVSAEDQLRERLDALGEKRDKLVEVGLIGKTTSKTIKLSDISKQETLSKFLSVYIEDTTKKLGVFDDIYEKIRLFKQIIDEHFSFKRIHFNKQCGILILDKDTNMEIPLSELSSGEQHELVLIYELLFKVKNGSLILIDEPELSLHVGWQKRFISDIQKIQKLKHITFVIATHSPQIINDKWELVRDLASGSAA